LSLTESGTLFYERCKVILEEMEEAELAVGSLNDAPHGTLKVTCPSWASGARLADMLAAYRRRYPDVVVDISFEDRLVDIIAEGYDLAIRATLGQPPAGLIARSLRPAPFVIVASQEYLQRCGVPRSPEDLARHDSIMIGDRDSWPLTGPSGKIEVPAQVVLRFRSVTVGVAHAACTGIGLAPLPRVMLEDPMFRDALCPVLPDYPLQLAHLHAIYVSRKHVPPKIRTFIDHVIEYMAQIPLERADS
jgi:DNA-binding transcriptional LysR family regulator